MTIKVKYETYRTDKPPIETIIEVPDDECAIMIETDYQRRLEVAEDKQSVERRDIQEIFTEDFNKPLYNNWHKANRHKGELSKPFRKDDEDADETDGLDFVPDYSDEERRERKEDYDAVCQKLRMMLKSEYAEVLIAIVLDGKTPEEYADEIGVHRDAIYKRLQRAKKKCAKVFWYYVENDHEAIIPKEIFMRVQDELVRRRLVKVSPNGRKHGFSSNHVFSQMIVCGECGELFRRVHWNNHGCRSIVWRCLSRLQSTGVICHARTVNEEVLKNVVLQAFNELLGSKSAYQKRLQDNLAAVIRGYADDEALEIDKRLAELQQELINHASRKEDYNDIADEIFRLREIKQKNFTDSAVRDEQVKRINELNDFISQQDTELTEFDESLARRWLKEITVWDDRFLVELKSGVVVEIMV